MPRTPSQPPAEPAEPKAQGAPGAVRIQKRAPKGPDLTREKLCATCGRAFRLEAGEKFFNCPRCHKKAQPPRKAPRKGEAQILTQITCVACGTQEYVAFVPTDPATALCQACFGLKRREQAAQNSHK